MESLVKAIWICASMVLLQTFYLGYQRQRGHRRKTAIYLFWAGRRLFCNHQPFFLNRE